VLVGVGVNVGPNNWPGPHALMETDKTMSATIEKYFILFLLGLKMRNYFGWDCCPHALAGLSKTLTINLPYPDFIIGFSPPESSTRPRNLPKGIRYLRIIQRRMGVILPEGWIRAFLLWLE